PLDIHGSGMGSSLASAALPPHGHDHAATGDHSAHVLSASAVSATAADTFPEVNPLILGDCPASVHDKYSVIGPDGLPYRTWHPIVDPETGCNFAHEHGDMLPPGAPLPPFGYAAAKAGMFTEIAAHPGFKVFSHSPGNLSGLGGSDV